MWRWQRIRRADIAPDLRERFELYGETLMAVVLKSGDANRIGTELATLGQRNREEIVKCRRERRDIAARHHHEDQDAHLHGFKPIFMISEPIPHSFPAVRREG